MKFSRFPKYCSKEYSLNYEFGPLEMFLTGFLIFDFVYDKFLLLSPSMPPDP